MNMPFAARRVSRDTLAYRNLLSHEREPALFEWLGSTWRCSVMQRCPSRPGLVSVEIDWGGARVVMLADRAWLEQVARDAVGDDVVSATPALVMQALLELAFGEASTKLEKATRKRVRIVGFTSEAPVLDGLEGFGWRMQSDAGDASDGSDACDSCDSCGELWVDSLGLGFLASAQRKLVLQPSDVAGFDEMRVPVRFAVGWVDLTRRALADVALRDVIALDESWLHDADRLTVRVGRSSAFGCVLKGTTLEVINGWTRIMEESLESSSPDDDEIEDLNDLQEQDDDESPEGVALDDIPVRLTFDLGERAVPLAELRAIAPGYTFDLGRDLRRAVTIRANGLSIGEGELVDIDGRIGVSILSLKVRTQ